MDCKTFYSLRKLIKEGKKRAASCGIVSFDLFDTLLVRRIHDPDLVKLPVARFISARAAVEGIACSWQSIQKLRDTIEQRHRRETGERFDDHEACYPQFIKELLATVFGEAYSDSLLAEVTSYELTMESSMLVPRQEVVAWLKELHDQGKRLFIVTDIYLPAQHIRVLCDNAGILDLVEDVVSSADSFLAKASGKAFPLMKQRYDLDPSSWLHVGDNPISDGLRPAQFGLQALVLRDGTEKFRKALVKRYVNYGKGKPFYRGRALQQLMLPLEAENVVRDDLYVEGYNFLGPLIGSFVQHIAEECRRLNLKRVFFFSREGYTFKKVWEQCAPFLFPDQRLPRSDYLYVSRMALAGASCAHLGLTRQAASIAFLPPGNRDFRDLARIFKFDVEAMVSHLRLHRLQPDTCLSPLHAGYDPLNSVRFMELLDDEDFQQEVRRQTRPASYALMLYLEEIGFFAEKEIGVVDIGWLGTIQRFLYQAVRHRDDCPRLIGYVFGATRGIPFEDDLKNNLHGVIYDRHRFDLGASCLLYARDTFEEACRAPHPTLDGYELTEEGYRLKFRSSEDATGQAEQQQDLYYSPLQQGLFDAAPRFAAASALLGYSLEDYRPWLNYLLTAKCAFPTTKEILTIRNRHHLDDFHGVHQPLAKKIGREKSLWNRSHLALRLSPLLRLRYFISHCKSLLRT
ncbi:MAG: HAD hydrolase-like protein [Desulfofustis sp.]|nr:HAD hydrolase-like protein [Desulfofustis sp.]